MSERTTVKCAWIQGKSLHFIRENINFYAGEVEKLAKLGAEVIFLPELFMCDYFPQGAPKRV